MLYGLLSTLGCSASNNTNATEKINIIVKALSRNDNISDHLSFYVPNEVPMTDAEARTVFGNSYEDRSNGPARAIA